MKLVEWTMQGLEFGSCNCAWGCSCQFNGPPTLGHCRAHTFVQIEKGRFGDVTLDGLRWGILGQWPAAIHMGNGTFQSIIDERANPQQRAALEAISQGKETEPGSLIWQVFSTTVTKLQPTLFKAIDLTIDLKTCSARVTVPGVIESSAVPISNPVTKAPHRVRVTLPTGFEFTEAEFGSGKATASSGPIELSHDGTHAHIAHIHWGTRGVVR
jgi:hypothetical protein